MTNEEITKSLKKLYKCREDFTVIQTGKASRRVNGLYKPDTREILLHNKNFKTDNALMFTAIHELTHHVLTTELGVRTARAHGGAFWPTFHDLTDKAVSLGIYSRERSAAVAKKTAEINEIQRKIIELQKRQGALLRELYETCEVEGDRIEDVLEHDVQMSRAKARELQQMSTIAACVSDEMTKAISSAKDVMARQAAIQSAVNGATVEQVRAAAKNVEPPPTKPADDGLDAPGKLRREKKRLEKTISALKDRLVHVNETLRSMGEKEDE